MFKAGILYNETLRCEFPIIVHQGGTSSGKTYSILQVLLSIAISQAKKIITVVGQDIPNLKVGALRDIENIINDSSELQALLKSYNKTDRVFEFHSGTIIEFKSYDNAQDAKSGKRDYLFINEANGISFDVYNELALRTKSQVYIDYNPNAEFWVHEHLIGKSNVKFFRSWHEHNPFLPQGMRDKIEALKEVDEDLWKVYARGLTGKIQGLIFRNWKYCEAIPKEATLVCGGMDFGFTNDPTAFVAVYKQDGELWCDLKIYETGLTNQDIANKLKALEWSGEIVADSAEPKSIQEIRNMGYWVEGAHKGKDSIIQSIDILKRFQLNITRSSSQLIKELNTYKWKEDKTTGKPDNAPVDFMNHAIDAIRYVALNKLSTGTGGYSINF